MKPKRKSNAGRPTTYRNMYAEQVRELFLWHENSTDKDIAAFFNVSESTVNLWKLRYPKFSESIRAGKMLANVKVGSALYQAATGYEATEEKALSDGEVIQVRKWIPGDVSAMKLWLTNRGERHWKDKHEQVVSNPDGSNLLPQTLIDEARLVADLLYAKTMEKTNGKPEPK